MPQGASPPPARQLSACPPCILWQGILAGHLWSCSRCLFWMLSVLGVFWSLLGRSWRVLSPLDRLLESLEALLEPPGALLAASWSLFGRSWGALGASWAPLGRLGGDQNMTTITWPKKVNFQTPQRRILLRYGGGFGRSKSTQIGAKTRQNLRRFSRAKKLLVKSVLEPSWADLGSFWVSSWRAKIV